jgi:hypothetical protein
VGTVPFTVRNTGQFDGGSAIGTGGCFKKGHPEQSADSAITGFIRIRANNFEQARSFLQGNPVYEAGGTVAVRYLEVSQ